jgi:replicative DNA helicase
MSESIELALLTRVMVDSDFHSLEKARIDESFFTNDIAREVYKYLRETYHAASTQGHVPSLEMTRTRFPSFYGAQPYDTVPVLSSELRRGRVQMELLALAQNLALKASTDPMAAMAELRAESAKIASLSEVGEDLSMASAYNMLLNTYDTVQSSSGMLGIPYPWDALNEETQGMQNGQFIVLYARPKSMKTWLGIYMGVCAYLKSRRRVLFYTREMAPKLVAQRVAAMLCGVDYKAFKSGKLQPEVKAKVFTLLQELLDDEKSAGTYGKNQPFFIITSDRSSGSTGGGGGVGWLQAKIRDLKPELVIVDGMYLMKDDRTNQRSIDWKQIAHISQDLKLTCQNFDIPLIGITQANRAAQKAKGEDLTELAFSDALGQDADAVFRVSKTEKFNEHTKKKETELLLTAPGLREGKFEGIVIHGEPCTNFGYIRTIVNLEESEADGGYGDKKEDGKRKFQRPDFMKIPAKGKM